MKYLHTMIRIKDVDESLRFFCEGLGLKETRRMENEKGRFTLIFLAAPNDDKAKIYNEDDPSINYVANTTIVEDEHPEDNSQAVIYYQLDAFDSDIQGGG